MKRLIHLTTVTALCFVFVLLSGCASSGTLEHPDPDPLSQQDQLQWKKSRITKSPYIRSGF